MRLRITYNAPFTLTFTLICFLITLVNSVLYSESTPTPNTFTGTFFMVYPFGTAEMAFTNPLMYLRLFSHAMGHANWMHFIGNFSFILLIGPILEEKYGSKVMLLMTFLTALITGILNAIFFPNPLLGASGIVFMMILMSSFTRMRAGAIPLTFILVAFIYIGGEVYNSFKDDSVSQFAHILGGICGAIFGYVFGVVGDKKQAAS